MEFDKVLIIKTEIRQMQNPALPERIIADVVLIDKTHRALQPLLYQLKKELDIEHTNHSLRHPGFVSFDIEEFMMVGEVVSIEKARKEIILSNKNIVSYNHLIVVSGSKGSGHDEEYTAGLQTLVNAVRMNKKFSESLKFTSDPAKVLKEMVNAQVSSDKQMLASKKLESLVSSKMMTQEELKSLSFERVYEVQV